jgi:hypothetical protein
MVMLPLFTLFARHMSVTNLEYTQFCFIDQSTFFQIKGMILLIFKYN